MFCQKLLSKPDVACFDPYGGWGDRMLGVCAASPETTYEGVDSNASLRPKYTEMQTFYNIASRSSFRTANGEAAILEAAQFDFVMSSPPFYYQEEQQVTTNKSAPWRLTEDYGIGTMQDYGEFMKSSLFVVFEEVFRRKKDKFLYVSEEMYKQLTLIVGIADETIGFKTSHSKTCYHNLYWWTYCLDRAAPSREALSEFVASVPFKAKVSRCPWSKAMTSDFKDRRARGQTTEAIAQESDIIRNPFVSAGHDDAEILKKVKEKDKTENKRKEGGGSGKKRRRRVEKHEVDDKVDDEVETVIK